MQLLCETWCVSSHQPETRLSSGFDKIEVLGNTYTYYPSIIKETIEILKTPTASAMKMDVN
jgi:hypothetical protein